MSNLDGLDETLANLDLLKRDLGEEVAKARVAGGNLVRATAVRSIQSASIGQTVTRSRQGGGTYEHTAASAGEAPNTDTGRLAASVQVEIRVDGVYVGSTLDYAGWLEFGTTKMEARPWLFPAVEVHRRNIEALHVRAVQMAESRYNKR